MVQYNLQGLGCQTCGGRVSHWGPIRAWWSLTTIGVLTSAPSFYGATMNAEAALDLGYTAANRYFLRLPEGADARATSHAIESAFSGSGLPTTLPKEQLAESRSAINSVSFLLQGFMGLGLLIGIAALGVATIHT